MKNRMMMFAGVFGLMMAAGAASAQEMNFYRIYDGKAKISGEEVAIGLKINDRVMKDSTYLESSKDSPPREYLDTTVTEGKLICKGMKLDLGTGQLALCSGNRLSISNPTAVLEGGPGTGAALSATVLGSKTSESIAKIVLSHTADQAGDHEGGIDE